MPTRSAAILLVALLFLPFDALGQRLDRDSRERECDRCSDLCSLVDQYWQKERGIEMWKRYAASTPPSQRTALPASDAQAKFLEEMNKLSENPEQDNTARMVQLLAGQGSPAQWSAPFRDMEGTGEIKYVMIGANQAIAIFQDEVLKATSIVAPRPAEPVDLTPDLEAAQEEAEMRSIFGY